MAVEMTIGERRQVLLLAVQKACSESAQGWITLRDLKRNRRRTFSPGEIDDHIRDLHAQGVITAMKIGRSVRVGMSAECLHQDIYKVLYVSSRYRNGVQLAKDCEKMLSRHSAYELATYELDNVVSFSFPDSRGFLLFLRRKDDSESAPFSEEEIEKAIEKIEKEKIENDEGGEG